MMTPRRFALLPPWTAAAWGRMRCLFWLKVAGIGMFMTGFFAAYFQVLRHPSKPVVPMPLTSLDDWIGFEPWALLPYVSLWLYVGIAPMLMRDFRNLVLFGLRVGGLCLTGLSFFYFWPTAVPPAAYGPAQPRSCHAQSLLIEQA